MAITDLLPFGRVRPMTLPQSGGDSEPFFALHRDMNRILDEFTRGFGVPAATRAPWSPVWPQVEISETEAGFKVVAEVPGLEEKDIELSLQDGVLTLKGEKMSETKGPIYSERWQGTFQRALQLGPDIDPDKVTASFKNGVLTITLAKRAEAQNPVKRIAISKG